MPQFAYAVKGITETNKTKEEVENDLRQACEEATDDGLHEVTEVLVDDVDAEDVQAAG